MDQTLILDLSSDEEVGFDNSSSADNFNYWLTKLLEDDTVNYNEGEINPNYKNYDNFNINNNNVDVDELDDVVVVGEVIVEKNKKIKTLVPSNCDYDDDDDDDDDDCVVLDGDPDKKKDEGVKDDNIDINCEKDDEGDDCDDLVIVGEKGQVACRDFPHARHSCAKYPFNSTLHEKCCDLCHCYVCDSLAPCAKWGSGLSSTDHCHATDKKEYWKLERTKFRELKNPSLISKPVTKPSIGSLPHSPQSHHISRGLNQLSRHSTNSGISSTYGPNRVSRRHRSSISMASNFQPNLLSRQLLRSCNNGNAQIPGNRGANILSRTRLVPCPMFKRSGFTSRPMPAICQLPSRPPSNASVAYLQMPHQQPSRQVTENISTNSTMSSLHSELNPAFPPVNTHLNLHLQGYSQTSPHGPTSQYNIYDHSSGIASNSNPYTYTPTNQSQNVPSVTQSTSGPFPDGVSTISQQGHQTLPEQSYSSVLLSCTTSNALNSVSPSCQESVPIQELLPANNDSELPLDFDMDYWLNDDGPALDLFDENNQASVHEPVDAGMLYFDFETSMKGLTHL